MNVEWAVIATLLLAISPLGHSHQTDLRSVVNAINDQATTAASLFFDFL